MPSCQPRSPQGAQCVELRLKPQLVPNQSQYEDEEEGDDGAAAQQTHRFVRGVAGATPQGLGVSSCGSSRSSKRAWSVPGSEDEEEGDDGAAAQQKHRFVGAWLEPRPRGIGVSSCGRSRSSKPQLEVSLRRRSVLTSSCLRLVEGGTDHRGGRAACLASSLRPHCSPRDLLPRWPAPFEAFKNRRDGVAWRGVPWRGVSLITAFFGSSRKKPSRVDRVYLSVPPLSTIKKS